MITTNKLIVIGGLSTENLHVSFPSYFYKGVYCEKKAHDKKNNMVEQYMVLRAEFFLGNFDSLKRKILTVWKGKLWGF